MLPCSSYFVHHPVARDVVYLVGAIAVRGGGTVNTRQLMGAIDRIEVIEEGNTRSAHSPHQTTRPQKKKNESSLEGSLKAKSKSAKNRARRSGGAQNRRVRRKPVNTAVLPVAVNGSPEAGKAVIPITETSGPGGNKLVPVAVRRASGEVVIPAEVRQRGGRKRTVAIRVAVNRPKAPKRQESSMDSSRNRAPRQLDPITNALVSATRIEENVVTLSAQIGITALDVMEHWWRFLFNRGVRVAKAAERGMMGEAVRAMDLPHARPIMEVEYHSPDMRERADFRMAA